MDCVFLLTAHWTTGRGNEVMAPSSHRVLTASVLLPVKYGYAGCQSVFRAAKDQAGVATRNPAVRLVTVG